MRRKGLSVHNRGHLQWQLRGFEVAFCPEQAAHRLAILDLPGFRHAERLLAGYPCDLEDLVIFGCGGDRHQIRGEIKMDDFRKHSWRAENPAKGSPAGRLLPCFLGEFTTRGFNRRLPMVYLARRQFPEPSLGRVAVLIQQADAPLSIQRDDGCASRVVRDFEVCASAIRQKHAFDVDGENPSLELRLRCFKHDYTLPMSADHPALIVVTGLPCTGKSTLAARLRERTGWPLLAKDDFKERLFATLGVHDREWSRSLSKASYELMFHLADELLGSQQPVIMEGNFRAVEHNATFTRLLAQRAVQTVQVFCSAKADVLQARMQARASTATRHPGHKDQGSLAELQAEAAAGTFVPLRSTLTTQLATLHNYRL